MDMNYSARFYPVKPLEHNVRLFALVLMVLPTHSHFIITISFVSFLLPTLDIKQLVSSFLIFQLSEW